MAGVFNSNGCWSCGFDFMPDGTIPAGGIFDITGGNWTVGAAFARFAGKGAKCSGANTAQRTLGVNLTTVITGFAISVASLPPTNPMGLCGFYDASNSTPQLGLCMNQDGSLQFYKTNPLDGINPPTNPVGGKTNPNVVVPNSYMYIEVQVTIGASGSAIVNVNGVQVLSITGNTQSTGNAWCSRLVWGQGAGNNQNYQFDDIYALDTTAPAPLNTFLGPGRIQTDGPNADSATGGLNAWAFTTPQGSDFGNAANIPANTAQFDSDATVGDRMSFRFPALTAKVFFLNMWYSAEIDAAGTRSLVPIYRNNLVDQVGPSPGNLNTTYTFYNQASNIDPNTGNPWPNGALGAAGTCELGVKVNT